MRDDLTTKVFTMVSEFSGIRQQDLHMETTLFRDLGIDGDDAVDFFNEFGKRFQVDLADFNLGKHFGPEASDPLSSVITWVQGWWTGDHHSAAGVTPVYLRDLVEAAHLGRWVGR